MKPLKHSVVQGKCCVFRAKMEIYIPFLKCEHAGEWAAPPFWRQLGVQWSAQRLRCYCWLWQWELGLGTGKTQGLLCWNTLWGCTWAQVSVWAAARPVCVSGMSSSSKEQQWEHFAICISLSSFHPPSAFSGEMWMHILGMLQVKNLLLSLFYLKKQNRLRKLFTDIHCSQIWNSSIYL